jgi:hypothetical protein
MKRHARIQDDGLTVKFRSQSLTARVRLVFANKYAKTYFSKTHAKAAVLWWTQYGIVM